MTTSKRMPPELLYELVRFIRPKQNVSAVLHSSRKLQHYLIPLLIKRKEAALMVGEKCVYATKFFDQMRHISAQYDAAIAPLPQQAGPSGSVEIAAAPPSNAAPVARRWRLCFPLLKGRLNLDVVRDVKTDGTHCPLFVSFSLPIKAECSAVHRFPSSLYSPSRRSGLAAQFRSLLAYFDEARRAHENRQKCDTKNTESDCSKKTETELQQLKRQLGSLGELFDQFLDTSLAMRERTQRVEDELERRFRRLELENAQLKAQLDSMQRMHNSSTAQGDNRTNANFGGTEQFAGAEPAMAPINLETISSTDEVVQQHCQQQQADNGDTNVDGGDSELARFVAQLPPVDESGQLMLNKFKYSCTFAQLLYTGGCHVGSMFCNIFSEYPATFFEELVEYALTTQRPDAMVGRICIWLAADEPWPDMATLFPSAVQRDISTDRVLYEFHNIGQSCGQQQRKRAEFVLRIRAPSRAKIFRTMSNFSLSRK
uniref:F-box domain-containing protein n=1 Tax=Globodera rostochiensis TaxID=31243 RepID=A0A914I458_GLORO